MKPFYRVSVVSFLDLGLVVYQEETPDLLRVGDLLWALRAYSSSSLFSVYVQEILPL